MNANKYLAKDGRYKFPFHFVTNICNYLKVMKCEYRYFPDTGLLNVYVSPTATITYYTTKNFSQFYFNRNILCHVKGLHNFLRLIKAVRGEHYATV